MKKLPFEVKKRSAPGGDLVELHYEGTTTFGTGDVKVQPYIFTVGNPALNPSPLGKAILDLIELYRALEAEKTPEQPASRKKDR